MRRKLTADEMFRRVARRELIVQTVPCPLCSALVGEPCVGTRDNVRLSPHKQRVSAFRLGQATERWKT